MLMIHVFEYCANGWKGWLRGCGQEHFPEEAPTFVELANNANYSRLFNSITGDQSHVVRWMLTKIHVVV